MFKSLQRRTFQILQPARHADLTSRVFDMALVIFIMLNVVAVVVETVNPIRAKYGFWFNGFELISVAFFTVEYVARLWSCTVVHHYRHPVWGRVRYALRPVMIIDLLAILPFYLAGLFGFDGRLLRLIRLIRLLRVVRLGRYSEALRAMGRVVSSKAPDLFAVAVVLSILLTLFSSLMYLAENKAQPDAFSSIPAAMWWGIVTLTTVGYGDIAPITPLGKVIGSIVAILGIGVFALPAGILAAGFSEELGRLRKHHERRQRLITRLKNQKTLVKNTPG